MDRLDEVAAGDVDKRDTDTETMMTTTLAAGIRTTNGRSRSAMSGRNDVVTLVSLLSSSGGSDSEHEDGADEKVLSLYSTLSLFGFYMQLKLQCIFAGRRTGSTSSTVLEKNRQIG